MRKQYIVLSYEADSVKEAGNKLAELVEDYLADDWYLEGGVAIVMSDGMYTLCQSAVRWIE